MTKRKIGGFAVAIITIVVLTIIYGSSISNSSAAVSVPFTKITEGTQSNIVERTNYLITSTEEFEKLWKIVDAKGDPPTIDFTKNSVAAIFAGTVSRVEDTDVRTVTVTSMNCSSKKATTTPYELITLPTTSLDFTHKDQETDNCL
jgi:hypothetical protein